MPDLDFRVVGSAAVEFAAAPELALKVALVNRVPGERIHGILLRCQVRIDAPQRTHEPEEAARLGDLFGPRADWGRTLRSLLWAQISLAVPAFEGATEVAVALPCSYDFALASTKYFHALAGGDVPLSLLFSGTVLHAAPDAEVQASPIPWTGEARYLLPHGVYRETLAHYYPDSVPLSLRRDVFDRLLGVRTAGGFATWDRTLEAILPDAPATAAPARTANGSE